MSSTRTVFGFAASIDCNNSTSRTMAGFGVVVVVDVVVVVVVVVELGIRRRDDPPPPPPNCCVILGRSLALIGRPNKVDSNCKSLLIVSISFLPFSISDLLRLLPPPVDGFSTAIALTSIELNDGD